MSRLNEVREYAQQIAEAISAVLQIDVEIADQDLLRVAGTGIYRGSVGVSMDSQGFIYREVIHRGHEYVIEQPGEHELCRPCRHRGHCSEKYEIVYPVNLGGRTVGAIGLVCFTDAKAALMRQSQDSYLTFIGKMAETLALKLKERNYLSGLESSNSYLNSIIDCLEEGLLTAGLDGQVQHYNRSARELFDSRSLPGASLESLLGGKTADEIIEAARLGSRLVREVRVDAGRSPLQLVLHARPVDAGGQRSIVITLSKLAAISRIVNRWSTHEAGYTVEDILGESDSTCQLRERARVIAPGSSAVLIRGESGTGKEMLARAIHNLSPRRQGPFVAVNCAAIPEFLLESELFGYEDGFTGTGQGGRLGKIELANGGTLFLEEIGDLPLFLQAKILGLLQESQIERVGGLGPIAVDLRVIAAACGDLEQMIAQGEFRQDLYQRISVLPVDISPLRERKEDLNALCTHFIRVYNRQLNRRVRGVSDAFRQKLWQYSWPGNVRELQKAIGYAINLAQSDTLDAEHLPPGIREASASEELTKICELKQLERLAIQRCLNEYGTTVKGKRRAAKALGIGIATLYRKMDRYNL